MLTDIVIVNDFGYVNGGASKVALTSAAALAARNHRVWLFTAVAAPSGAEIDKRVRPICTDQYEILQDPDRLRAATQGLWNLSAAGQMGELLRKLDPITTVVHVHSWTKALSSSVVREAIVRNFKVVVSLHDYFVACPNGGFLKYPEEKICHLTPMSLSCVTENCDARSYSHKLWRVARQFIQSRFGLLPGAVRHFILVSEFSEQIMTPYLPPESRVYRIPNPITISKQSPVAVGANPVFAYVGRLSPEKGAVLFARAAAAVGCDSLFVGDGPCRQEVLAANSRAEVTGWLPSENVQAQLQRARALVFPSLSYETQGVAVLEAAALGVPAIVSDTCAARDSVANGVTGLWFAGGATEDLARKIRLMQDAGSAARMGRVAYERYWSNPPTLELHLSKLLACYESVLRA